MVKRPQKPGIVAKTIATIFLVFEFFWLRVTLPSPQLQPEKSIIFFYLYFFIVLFVGPFLIFDSIRYLKSRWQHLILDKVYFALEIAGIVMIIYVFFVTANSGS